MIDTANLNIPPNNIDAEKALLSSIMLDNETMYVLDGLALVSEDFYESSHRMIFDAIKELWFKRKTIDVITISDGLNKTGQLDTSGGLDYLNELATFALTPTAAYDYGKIVKEKSTLRNILKTCQKVIGDVYSEKDTIQILDDIEKKIFDLTQVNFADSLIHIKDILSGRYEYYHEISNDKTALDRGKVFSGFDMMDNLLGGFKPGELIILAARPSMGKTSFALNIAENVAIKQHKTIAMFSLEMGKEQIVDRILSSVSQISYSKIHKGLMDTADFDNIGDAMSKLGDANIYIDDKGGSTVGELRSKLRKVKIEKGTLDLVIIDYLQLMNATNVKVIGNRVQEISEISRNLKELARELEVPVLALSQLSRAAEQRNDKRPQLSDLRDSGAIEQDADSVLMLYREDYYDPEDEEARGKADVFIRKNRNGPTGEIKLRFMKEIMQFHNITGEDNF